MKKKGLLTALSIMAVGFAAVSTTLYINGSSTINSNDKDFKVYYSNALVNGTQDLSVVVDETHLSFTTTLETLGDTYILDYDVTNGSKNYDADLEMTCTGGNEYLTVSNEFDTSSNLAALATRGGKLTLTQIKSNSGDDINVTIDCNIKANAVERNSLGSGTAASPVEKPLPKWIYTDSDNDSDISIGDEIVLAANTNEIFYVISQTANTVSMLAKYNIGYSYNQGPIYRQSSTLNNRSFSNAIGWEYTPGPKEIDIQQFEGNVKKHVNEYVSYLQSQTFDNTIIGDLITLSELGDLGCVYPSDYLYPDDETKRTCVNSPYKKWLINKQHWWTRSVSTNISDKIWFVNSYGDLIHNTYQTYSYGIRPVITISKSDLGIN